MYLLDELVDDDTDVQSSSEESSAVKVVDPPDQLYGDRCLFGYTSVTAGPTMVGFGWTYKNGMKLNSILHSYLVAKMLIHNKAKVGMGHEY